MGATPKELPQEVTNDILCRLPIKSVLRFRCVCKYWFHLLSFDLHFNKLHFHKQLQSNRPSLIALIPEKPLRLYYASDYTACHKAIKFDLPFHESSSFFGKYVIFGVCNGLICIGEDSKMSWNIHIWNPLTSDHIIIPNPPPVRNFNHRVCNSLGFGFHEDINEYKVIRLVHLLEGWDYTSQVSVYTLGTNSWRSLKEIPYVVSSHSSHVILVNGALHWLANKTALRSWYTILSFDIKDEAFQEIPFPNGVGYDKSCRVRVAELGGLLSVFWHGDQKMQIWSLKEYGVGDSWMKLCEVQQSVVPAVSFSRFKLIGLASNHEIIVKTAGNLSLYNPQNNSITKLRKFKGYVYDVFAYQGRFTSLQNSQFSQ